MSGWRNGWALAASVGILAACGANVADGEPSNDRGAAASNTVTRGHDADPATPTTSTTSTTAAVVAGHDRAADAYAAELAHGHDELIPCIASELLVRWPNLADRVADTSWPAGQEANDVRYLGLSCVLRDRPHIVDQDVVRQVIEEVRSQMQAVFQTSGLPADDPTMDCVMLGIVIDANDFLLARAEGRVPTAAELEQIGTVFDACDMGRTP